MVVLALMSLSASATMFLAALRLPPLIFALAGAGLAASEAGLAASRWMLPALLARWPALSCTLPLAKMLMSCLALRVLLFCRWLLPWRRCRFGRCCQAWRRLS